MISGRLGDVGLYELDIEDLYGKAEPHLGGAPTMVLLDCGLYYDLWYPLPRLIIGTLSDFLRHHRRGCHPSRPSRSPSRRDARWPRGSATPRYPWDWPLPRVGAGRTIHVDSA